MEEEDEEKNYQKAAKKTEREGGKEEGVGSGVGMGNTDGRKVSQEHKRVRPACSEELMAFRRGRNLWLY